MKKKENEIEVSYQELAKRLKPHIEELRKTRPLAVEFSNSNGHSHDFIQKIWNQINESAKILKEREWASIAVVLAVFEDLIREGTFAGKLKNIIYRQIEAEYRKNNNIGDYPAEVQSPYLQFPEVYSNIRIDTWEKLAAMGYKED